MSDEETQKDIDRCIENMKKIVHKMILDKERNKQIGELIKRIGDKVKE